MTKTMVCILDEEVMLNYLFVKEAYKPGDDVLLIVSRKFQSQISFYRKLMGEIGCEMQVILLEHPGDEIIFDVMCRTIQNHLVENHRYYVNLSGGTRQMSIAVQQVFARFKTKFFFLPKDRNVIIHSQLDDNFENDDDYFYPINHKVTVEEYLRVAGLRCRFKSLTQSEEYTHQFFDVFTGGALSQNDYDTLETLRDFRNLGVSFVTRSGFRDMEGLHNLLETIKFKPSSTTELSPLEIQYITGGWFEEYVYFLIQRLIRPDDLRIGVEISRSSGLTSNDIDVAFTLDNRLHVIECKTGVGKRKLYNQILYKACALNEALLGIRSKAYIFSLNYDSKEILYRLAKNMGIVYCDRGVIEDNLQLKELIFMR